MACGDPRRAQTAPSSPSYNNLEWADDTTFHISATAKPGLEKLLDHDQAASHEGKTYAQSLDERRLSMADEGSNSQDLETRRSIASKKRASVVDKRNTPTQLQSKPIGSPKPKKGHLPNRRPASVATTPWTKKIILTIDGGGVRAYSSLILLRGLMKRIRDAERAVNDDTKSSADSPLLDDWSLQEGVYLPCHYFDYIAGTSFGGYLSIMLGRLQLSVEQCIRQFRNFQSTIDKDPRFFEAIPSLINVLHRFDFRNRSWPTKDTLALYDPLKESYSERPTFEQGTKEKELHSDPIQCKTIALCMKFKERKGRAHAFYSFPEASDASQSKEKSPKTPRRSSHTVVEVAKAITTPPISFSPYTDDDGSYVDGTILLKNPTSEVYKQVTRLQNGEEPAIDSILSVGHSDLKSTSVDLLWRIGLFGRGKIESKPRSSKMIDAEMRLESKEQGFRYQRFEVEDIFHRIRPHALEGIEEATEEFIDKNDEALREYAAYLVERRLARAATRPWEVFALGLQYQCGRCKYAGESRTFPNRRLLIEHLKSAHGVKLSNDKDNFAKFERELDESRVPRIDDSGFPPASKRYENRGIA